MVLDHKIFKDLCALEKVVKQLKKEGKKIVICQGHFDVIHAGHIRFLEFARKQGDYLLIAVQGHDQLTVENYDKFQSEDVRVKGIIAIHYVDNAIVFNKIKFAELLEIIRPDVYVRGKEFAKHALEMKDEISIVEKHQGKVVFSSGYAQETATELFKKDIFSIKSERAISLKNAIVKQNIKLNDLLNYCDSFKDVKVLVIGDTIVDQYIVCDPLGVSSTSPVLVLKELEEKCFVGGAAVVARHVRALGAKCSFLSMIGNDDPGKLVYDELSNDGIDTKLIVDTERPTTFKMCYMVGSQKLLRVSRMNDNHMEKQNEREAIAYLTDEVAKYDCVIVSDFGYGVFTPKILKTISSLAKKYNIKLFGDVQCSTQMEDITKLKNYYALTPTEKEARMALYDKYSGLEVIGRSIVKKSQATNVFLKLAENGFIIFDNSDPKFMKTQYFPALNPNPIDVAGAGDSMLAAIAVSIGAGANIMEASVMGSGISSIKVSIMGNIPVSLDELKNWLGEISDKMNNLF